MGKHKRIKFYDSFELKYIYLSLEEVQKHFKKYVGVDYDNIDDYINIHGISEKHKKAILNNN